MKIAAPRPVTAAVVLLLVTHAADLWSLIQLSGTLGVPLWMPYSVLAVIYALLFTLLVLVLLGWRWARTVYAVFGILGLLSMFGQVATLSALEWLVVIVDIVALVLLFAPASNAWFARRDGRGARRRDPPGGPA